MVHCGAKMVEDPGSTHDQGSRVNDQGSNSKSRIQDKGSKISKNRKHGLCFVTDGHPRGDTDIILKGSKALIDMFVIS